MPRFRRLIPAILAGMLLILAACRPDPVRRQLLAADAIIETAPDSALAILSRISPADLAASPAANRPLHALLLTQAQTKCGVIITSDSLISIALRAYGSEGSDPDLRKRAHFYAADIAYNSGDLSRSMRHALTARDVALQLADPYWTAKSAEVIADIFNASYNNHQAEIYRREAADNYLRAGRIRNHRYALCDLATELTNQKELNKALCIFDSLKHVFEVETPSDTSFFSYLLNSSLPALYYSNRNDELHMNVRLLEEIGYQPTHSTMILSCNIFMEQGKEDSAAIYLNGAYKLTETERDTLQVKYAAYKHFLNMKDYKNAALTADTLLQRQGRMAECILQEAAFAEQGDYYSQKAEAERRRSHQLNLILIVVSICAVLIIASFIALYRFKVRAKQAELDSSVSAFIAFKEQTVKQSEEQQRIIESLFKDKWSTLNMLCNEYFDMGETAANRLLVINRIGKELEKMRSTKQLKEIEHSVDQHMNGILSTLRHEIPELKDDDFSYLALLISGFSVRSVCLLTGIKYKYFYLKRSRLIKKIRESSAPHKEEFLQRLN